MRTTESRSYALKDTAPGVRGVERFASWLTCRIDSWIAVDWAVALYATFVAILAVARASSVPKWPHILFAHMLLVTVLIWLPPRGAAWERPRPDERRPTAWARDAARFLRYTYAALLLTPFFEEVALTVNAIAPGAPYWFERHLYAIDRAIAGATPAVWLSQAGFPILDEIMHAFYLSYFAIIPGGVVIAWTGGRRGRTTPAAGFHAAMTTMMLGFLLSYVWYPFLPARGPWENPELMAGLRPFGGWVFTSAIKMIVAHAAVSGGCFPSAHVSGTWALTFGLYPRHRKVALIFGLVAVGLSAACVYTRYHHGIDVLAGFTVAVIAARIGRCMRDPGRCAPPSDRTEKAFLCRTFIAHSPSVLLGTSDRSGRCDVSPKGDAPGFVSVLDDTHLLLPDRPGNKRLDGMRNLLSNAHVGLLFLIPTRQETLRVNGRACIIRDGSVLQRCAVQGKRPLLGVLVEVEEVFMHCGKASWRSQLWDPSQWPDVRAMPSPGCMLYEHAKPAGMNATTMDERFVSDKERLY